MEDVGAIVQRAMDNTLIQSFTYPQPSLYPLILSYPIIHYHYTIPLHYTSLPLHLYHYTIPPYITIIQLYYIDRLPLLYTYISLHYTYTTYLYTILHSFSTYSIPLIKQYKILSCVLHSFLILYTSSLYPYSILDYLIDYSVIYCSYSID